MCAFARRHIQRIAEYTDPPNKYFTGAWYDRSVVLRVKDGYKISALITSGGSPAVVANLTIDGNGSVVNYNTYYGANDAVCCENITVDNVYIKNVRCDAIQIAGPNVVVQGSIIEGSGFFPSHASCIEQPAAAVYATGEHYRDSSPNTSYNTFVNNARALDSFGMWGGTFSHNTITGSRDKGILLYGYSNWYVEYNNVSGTGRAGSYPCDSPGGSAGIVLCRTAGSDPKLSSNVTKNNHITGNIVSDYIGLVSLGKRDRSVAPEANFFINNTINNAVRPCYDTNLNSPANDGNTWSGNNCVPAHLLY